MKKTNILGVQFNNINMKEAVKQAIYYTNQKDTKIIYTPNPEIVMEAYNNESLKSIVNKADMVVADGIGVVIGSRIIKRPLPERVAGYDLVQNLFSEIKDAGKTVYFFGAAKGVAELAASKMEEEHKGLKIVGTHDGYFDNDEEIINEINTLKPDILLVGLGAPKQEFWIFNNKDDLDVKLCIGVGGSFDGMAGKVKRAPILFRKLGLEWFYRLIMQPTRIKRMMRLPIFLIKVILTGKRYKQID
jgi:N-acetylglucosaminyldiphosphoundecaprenol N-acetyl-beta-D-mannosaminyltransferase